MKKEYATIKEFATKFNVTASAVHKWILEKKIQAIQLDGTNLWRIPITEIDNFEIRSQKSTQENIFNRRF